jgi:hypothetical protein
MRNIYGNTFYWFWQVIPDPQPMNFYFFVHGKKNVCTEHKEMVGWLQWKGNGLK